MAQPEYARLTPSRNLQYDLIRVISTHACNCAKCTTAQVIEVSMTVKRTRVPGAPPVIDRETVLLVRVDTKGSPTTFFGPTPLGYEESLKELAEFCLKNSLPLHWKVRI